MAKQPRAYQNEATEAVLRYLTNESGKPLVVAPVAAGKSLLMAEVMRRSVEMYAPMRFLSLAHSSELLKQNAAELAGQAPHIRFSFYSDKLKQKDFSGQCIFAGIQSIYRQAWKVPPIDLCLIDEAHLTGKKETKMFRGLLDVLWKGNPNMRVVGYTGTPFNLKGGWLHEGDGALFDEIAYYIPMIDLIEEGHLCRLETPQITTRIDVAGVKTVAGDYALNELEAVSDRPEIIRDCVKEILVHGEDCQKWLVFAVSVKHAMHIRDEIRGYGISCEAVTGKTPAGERSSIIQSFEHGTLRCLVNVMALTTGFNNPKIDLLALMRPTRSRILYVQSVGRGMRTCLGKTRCKVLDFGGVIQELGPVDKITVKRPKLTGLKDAPMKDCPQCHEFLFASARICHGCGHVFPMTAGDINLSATASSAAVLSTQKVEPIWTPVDAISYSKHEKVGSPPSMLVEYRCGATRHREWICLQHAGRARAKAMHWWMKRSDQTAPFTVDDALGRAEELSVPVQIGIAKEGKYFKVVDWAFEGILPVTTALRR